MKRLLERVFESDPLSHDSTGTGPDACPDCGGVSLPGAVRCVECMEA